eukprot:TRINITY_DN12677_c0_g1_i2.p1 TRINITY_DN12677_c0_g1~~TRINITY_DN12677_c0_g1_i2.p1  ORF type:complete len:146 (+),score=24.56 TRINITY_DN12677_c0_g1_i2:83-520(+)
MGCCQQKAPENAADYVGELQITGSGVCGCSKPFRFKKRFCCGSGPAPAGKEWDAAAPGMEALLDEVDSIGEFTPACCKIADFDAAKKKLDEQWLPKVQAHLGQHGLTADIEVFWVYNGQSSSQEMRLRVYTLKLDATTLGVPATA